MNIFQYAFKKTMEEIVAKAGDVGISRDGYVAQSLVISLMVAGAFVVVFGCVGLVEVLKGAVSGWLCLKIIGVTFIVIYPIAVLATTLIYLLYTDVEDLKW